MCLWVRPLYSTVEPTPIANIIVTIVTETEKKIEMKKLTFDDTKMEMVMAWLGLAWLGVVALWRSSPESS